MRLDNALRELATGQHSVVATWQVRDLGADRTEVSRLRRSQQWEVETPRVLRVAGAAVTRELRASVAALDAGRGAGLSHECGAAWWGVPGCRLDPLHVAQAEPRANNRSTIAQLHDLLALPEEWTTVLNGVRVVRPELIVFQICGSVHPLRAERILDAAWSIRIVSGRSLRHAYDTFRGIL